MTKTIRLLALAALAALTGASVCSSSAMPTGEVLKGHLARKVGDYAGAVEHYKAALEKDPESADLRLRLVRLLVVFGETEQALSILDEGLELREGHPELLFEKSRALLLSGRTAEAADFALKASEKGGGAQAHAMAARLLQGAERYEDALIVADRWISEDGDRIAEPHYQRGSVLERLGRDEDAEEAFARALELMPGHLQALEAMGSLYAARGDRLRAIEYLEKVIALNPHLVRVRLDMALLLIENGDMERALEKLSEAEDWLGGDPQSRIRLGLIYLQAGKPGLGLGTIEQIPEESREDRAWLFIGIGHILQEDYQGALDALEEVDANSPLYTEALVRRAQVLRELGRIDEAIEALSSWVREHPSDVDTLIGLAGLLQDEERFEEAAKILKSALTDADEGSERILFNLGVVYDKMDDWEQSAGYMKRLLKVDPDDAHALNYLGYTYAEQGVRLKEALELVEKADRLLPGNGFITDSLGWVHYKLGNYERARDYLEKAIELTPDDPIIWEHLGDVYVAMGEKEEARKAYERSLEITPDNVSVQGKLDELN